MSAGGLALGELASPPVAVTVEHLTVRLGAADVLRDLSFGVGTARALAIIGPNGSGKTVLLRTLIGALPFTGRVTWAAGARIGYVPQKLDLERGVPLTGLDFLHARAALARRGPDDVERALDLVGMALDGARQAIGALSGGQFQRLLLAFALVGSPTVLLLDEPTAGVDEPGQALLNDLVERLRRESALTVLFVSHDLSVVYRHATDVLCLSRSRPCVIGPPRVVLTPALLQEIYGSPVAYHIHDD